MSATARRSPGGEIFDDELPLIGEELRAEDFVPRPSNKGAPVVETTWVPRTEGKAAYSTAFYLALKSNGGSLRSDGSYELP